ncbi:trimeric intracellular cation channel type B isoform X2 [Drosophila ficusphila]|uniref:trimeric intracellular cation channel type B isoform X2 n=1 Tax=Drosophila ficusphila TaxID=30025 RepID=UPI0007E68B8A|nr:trimeric intracellular cation channel type B isoform X2 [Drosophila ficusphila]
MNARLMLRQLPSHLIFRILHYSLISHQLRDELGFSAGSLRLKRCGNKALEWQPFAFWLTNLLVNYSGDILGNLLLGSLPLEPLCNTADIILSSFIWYCIFYCPFELGNVLAGTMAFRILATATSTISQVQLIDKGVHLAGQVYGNAPVPMLVVGTVMGSGAEILKPVASILINRCQNNQMAYIKLSNTSKLALFISLLFMLEIYQSPLILGLNRHQLIIHTLVLTTALKFLSLTYRTNHFVWLLERQMQYILFGGLSRDLGKFFERLPNPETRRTWAFSEFD